MNKREFCESRESIAYYSGLNGLEIKGIEYGISRAKQNLTRAIIPDTAHNILICG